MTMSDATTIERYYNKPIADVYAKMKETVMSPESSFHFERSDDLSCSVTFTTGISMVTWGERLTASAIPNGEGTLVRLAVVGKIESSDMLFQNSKQLKVADRFFTELSASFENNTVEIKDSSPAAEPSVDSNIVAENFSATKSPTEKNNGKLVAGIVAAIIVVVVLICVIASTYNNKQLANRVEWLHSLESACDADDAITVLDDNPGDESLTLDIKNNGESGIEPLRCVAANTNMPETQLNNIIENADTDDYGYTDLKTFNWDTYQLRWHATRIRFDDMPTALSVTIKQFAPPADMRIKYDISDFKTEEKEADPAPFNIDMYCTVKQSDSDITGTGQTIEGVTSLNYQEKTWVAGQPISCNSNGKDSDATGEKSDKDYEALRTAYGDNADTTEYGLGALYSICASTAMVQLGTDMTMSEVQGNELLGALVLCPNHPRAEEIRNKVNADAESLNEIQEKTAQGLIKTDGTYRIPSEMATGTWRTTRDEVKNCYWEIQDSNGQIMSNDFIPGGIGQTITIPEGAAGFYSEGCGAWEKQ